MINIRSRLLMATTACAFLLTLPVAPAPAVEPGPCATDKRVVAACYQVHGRLSDYADMRTYLWQIGSKHMYEIWYGDNGNDEPFPPLPTNLSKVFNPEVEVFGDFMVCPFDAPVPGVMQNACIDSAQHLVVQKIPPYVPPKN